MFVSQEAAQMITTGLASLVVSVEIKRTVTEAQRTLMLPHSRTCGIKLTPSPLAAPDREFPHLKICCTLPRVQQQFVQL